MGSSPLAAANNSPAGYGSLIVNASCIDGPDWGGHVGCAICPQIVKRQKRGNPHVILQG